MHRGDTADDERPGPVGDDPAGPMTLAEDGIDFERANAARIYDYLLGGAHNFAVDRELAERLKAVNPGVVDMARTNRAFLGRAVRWCVEQGIDQFLDLGSGVPTVGNVHEIAHQRDPSARIAYVDFEPVAVQHAREITADLDTVSVTRGDLRMPRDVLAASTVADHLDLTRPVAVLAVAVLHFVHDDVGQVLARYREGLAPGSMLVISHASDDMDDPEMSRRVGETAALYRDSATPVVLRDRLAIRALLGDVELAPPGLVELVNWPTPDSTESTIAGYGAVGVVR